jgi:hypothetical protein
MWPLRRSRLQCLLVCRQHAPNWYAGKHCIVRKYSWIWCESLQVSGDRTLPAGVCSGIVANEFLSSTWLMMTCCPCSISDVKIVQHYCIARIGTCSSCETVYTDYNFIKPPFGIDKYWYTLQFKLIIKYWFWEINNFLYRLVPSVVSNTIVMQCIMTIRRLFPPSSV